MDQTRLSRLEGIAAKLKQLVTQTGPQPWQARDGDGVAGAGGTKVLTVHRTAPTDYAQANIDFTVYAHENVKEIAQGLLDLIEEAKYASQLEAAKGKGAPYIGNGR